MSGYTLRASVSSLGIGDTPYIQANDISSSKLYLDKKSLCSYNLKNVLTSAYTEFGDVLLSSRGISRAVVIKDRGLLVSSSLFVIRVENIILMPEYLAIYLNSNLGQENLNKIKMGGTIPSFSKSVLLNMVIPVPDIDVQEKIVELYLNIEKQNGILNRKVELNQMLFENIFKLNL